jgi:hypothetical protein
MPRFFFDFRQGRDRALDTEGTEFVDSEQAYLEAFKAAQEMWSDLLRQRQDPRRCYFDVCDAERNPLFTLPFQEVMDSCRDSQPASLQDNFRRAMDTVRYANRIRDEMHEAMKRMRQSLHESRDLLSKDICDSSSMPQRETIEMNKQPDDKLRDGSDL